MGDGSHNGERNELIPPGCPAQVRVLDQARPGRARTAATRDRGWFPQERSQVTMMEAGAAGPNGSGLAPPKTGSDRADYRCLKTAAIG